MSFNCTNYNNTNINLPPCPLFLLCDTYTLLTTQQQQYDEDNGNDNTNDNVNDNTTNGNNKRNNNNLSLYNTRILQRLQILNNTAGKRWTLSLQRYQYIYNQQLLTSKLITASYKFASLSKLIQSQYNPIYNSNNIANNNNDNNTCNLCFNNLPIELNIYILSLLTPNDISNAIQVCHDWCNFILLTHTNSLYSCYKRIVHNNNKTIKHIEHTLNNNNTMLHRQYSQYISDTMNVIESLDYALSQHRRSIVLQWIERISYTLAPVANKNKQLLCIRVFHLAAYICDIYRLHNNKDIDIQHNNNNNNTSNNSSNNSTNNNTNNNTTSSAHTDNDSTLQLDYMSALMISSNSLLCSSRSGAVLTADQSSYLLDNNSIYTTDYVRENVSNMTEWLIKNNLSDINTHYDYVLLYSNILNLSGTSRWLCNILSQHITIHNNINNYISLYSIQHIAASIVCLISGVTSLDSVDDDVYSSTLDDIADKIESTNNNNNNTNSFNTLKSQLNSTQEWNKLPSSTSTMQSSNNITVEYSTEHNTYTIHIKPRTIALPWLKPLNKETLILPLYWNNGIQWLTQIHIDDFVTTLKWLCTTLCWYVSVVYITCIMCQSL